MRWGKFQAFKNIQNKTNRIVSESEMPLILHGMYEYE